MDIKELKSFCDSDRHAMKQPFSIGNYTYATDGHICIRVKRLNEINENEYAPNPNKILVWDHNKIEKWFDLPKYNLDDFSYCSACQGTGKATECEECEGAGEIECESCSHKSDCNSCDGSGGYPGGDNICYSCKGTKKDTKYKGVEWRGKETLIAIKYLIMLGDLKECKISDKGVHSDAIRFKFDGGEGLLMPLRL